MKKVNLEFDLDDLFEMTPNEQDELSFAIEGKVAEFCKQFVFDIDKIDYDSQILCRITIKLKE